MKPVTRGTYTQPDQNQPPFSVNSQIVNLLGFEAR